MPPTRRSPRRSACMSTRPASGGGLPSMGRRDCAMPNCAAGPTLGQLEGAILRLRAERPTVPEVIARLNDRVSAPATRWSTWTAFHPRIRRGSGGRGGVVRSMLFADAAVPFHGYVDKLAERDGIVEERPRRKTTTAAPRHHWRN